MDQTWIQTKWGCICRLFFLVLLMNDLQQNVCFVVLLRIFMLEQFLRWTSNTSSSPLQMIMFLSSWRGQKWCQCSIRYCYWDLFLYYWLTHSSTQIFCTPFIKFSIIFIELFNLSLFYFNLLWWYYFFLLKIHSSGARLLYYLLCLSFTLWPGELRFAKIRLISFW